MAEDIQNTLDERGARYGDFTEHAAYAQRLQNVMRCGPDGSGNPRDGAPKGWDRLNYIQRQALTVIADKIARILNGDPNYDDNWRDIIGYATLVLDRLPGAIQRAEAQVDAGPSTQDQIVIVDKILFALKLIGSDTRGLDEQFVSLLYGEGYCISKL
jgi:hypothetical protein